MRISRDFRMLVPAWSMLVLSCSGVSVVAQSAQLVETLHVFTHVSPLDSYGVTSTLVYGPTEAILIDTQFHISEATALADEIAAKGKKLKAIFITHPDEDHYLGTAVMHQRFPDTPIFMTADALTHFQTVVASQLAGAKKALAADAPDAVPTPELLPSTHQLVDGQSVEIIRDLQGDVLYPTNSSVWMSIWETRQKRVVSVGKTPSSAFSLFIHA